MQIVWLGPAEEIEGTPLTVTVRLSVVDGQIPLEMVQAKTFGPVPNAVTNVVGETEFEIVPLPETKVQTPVPAAGVFAVIRALGLEAQMV